MNKLPLLLLFFSSSFHLGVLAQSLYTLDTITKIELYFAEEDWEYPLHYYRSLKKGNRHQGKLKLNGKTFDGIGARFKGFSSYRRSFKKNPLNIKLNHSDKSAHYQGYTTLKLSNGNLDPSWLREVLSYQIARKYMVAPQSNYAEVYVNGNYYGLFGNTEAIGISFAKQHFNITEDVVIVKGNAPAGPFSGRRSSLEYLGEDIQPYQEAYELEEEHGWDALQELTYILNRQPANIERLLNMDEAIWMLAFNNVLVNLDSYSDFQQNYYLIQDQRGQFHFVLWDLNLSFDGLGKTKGVIMQPEYDPFAKQRDPRYPLINLVLALLTTMEEAAPAY